MAQNVENSLYKCGSGSAPVAETFEGVPDSNRIRAVVTKVAYARDSETEIESGQYK
jgi:hypothetical protein